MKKLGVFAIRVALVYVTFCVMPWEGVASMAQNEEFISSLSGEILKGSSIEVFKNREVSSSVVDNRLLSERIRKRREERRLALSQDFALKNNDLPLKAAANVTDSLALVALFNATNGPAWKTRTNWLVANKPLSSWYGVTLDGAGRVKVLTLNNNKLSGTLPTEIGNLTALEELYLYSNSLSGSIPAEIGNLTSLKIVEFEYNQLSGTIPPSIGNLTNLQYLYLYRNNISGSIPPEFGNLSSLIEFDISENSMTGSIPTEFGNLSSLQYTYLSYNHFNGAIPSGLGNLSSIVDLDLTYNDFRGLIPSEIGGLSTLNGLYVDFNSYVFSDIEPVFNWSNFGDILFTYSNQAKVGVSDTLSMYMESPIHISINGYEPSVNDAFQWFRNDTLLVGENDSVFNVLSASRAHAGEYRCDITNSIVTGLTISSNVVTVDVLNHIPVANAGPNQDVDENTLVTLDASASSDGDNDPLTYHWSAPIGFFLSSPGAINPTFTAPDIMTDSTFVFTLVVNDGLDNSAPDTVLVTIRQINKIPVANAGSDQTVDEQTLVELDGRSSSDGDPHPLTFAWTSPEGITLNSNTDSHPTFTAPNVTKDTSYTFVLVVNDGFDDSAPDTVMINVSLVNIPPVANAGFEQTVNENTEVTLDATASSDADGHPVTYLWTPPVGISLSSTTDPLPTFTTPEVPRDTTLYFLLVVNDGYDNSIQDTAMVNVLQVNRKPVANAGADQFANREGDQISLDASASSDFDGDLLTFNWSAPAGLVLNDSTIINPTFTVPNVGMDTTFHIILVVSDGIDESTPDTVAIAVINNLIPVANAGTDQTVEEGELVQLSAAASSDGNSDPLTYNWSAPIEIVLSDGTVVNPTFTAPNVERDTTFQVTVTVNDGFEDSEADTVVITVKNKVAAVPETLALTNVTLTTGQAECYDAVQTITVAGSSTTVVLQSGSTADFIAGQRINFLPGFHARSGSRMHAYISSIFCDPVQAIVQADTYEKGAVIDSNVKPTPQGDEKTVKVYPNPTTGRVVVELVNYEYPAAISVYNMKGAKIKGIHAAFTAEFSLSSLEKGLYIIQVTGDNTVKTQKVLLQ